MVPIITKLKQLQKEALAFALLCQSHDLFFFSHLQQSSFTACCTLPVSLTRQEQQTEGCCNTINDHLFVRMRGCLHSCVNTTALLEDCGPGIHNPPDKHVNHSVICVILCFNSVKLTVQPQGFHFQFFLESFDLSNCVHRLLTLESFKMICFGKRCHVDYRRNSWISKDIQLIIM